MDGGPALTAVAGPRGAGGASGVEGDSSFSEYLEKYCVHVCKQDFKFNAAHFVAYRGFRERLHGHNYTVGVRLEAEGIQSDGYVVDFGDIKKVARAVCKELNELFLCPEKSDVLDISVEGEDGGTLRIQCEDGAVFRFPRQDAVMLPIKHSTVEELAHYVCSKIIERYTTSRLTDRGITVIHVTVSEAPGQDATYSRTFRHHSAGAELPISSPRDWRTRAAPTDGEQGGGKRAKR